jgi:hypothetical protein
MWYGGVCGVYKDHSRPKLDIRAGEGGHSRSQQLKAN